MGKYLLGEYVKQRRAAMGLSLRDFGQLCGISHTTIDVIERGFDPRTGKSANITNATFEKLSLGLNEPVEKLVALSCGDVTTNEKEQPIVSDGLSDAVSMELLQMIRSATEEERRDMLDLLRIVQKRHKEA